MAEHWAEDAIFYHIYPLGLCGAPPRNDFGAAPVPRLAQLAAWGDHLRALGVNALYLGPVFEASAHGYDTSDYFRVDRRLGDNETLATLIAALHHQGIRVILDGVFRHVGRDFWALSDVRTHLAASPYAGWFQGLTFGEQSPYGDPFTYEGWDGHYDLVRLDLHHPDVQAHLLAAVAMWIETFDIDGLRLDVAGDLAPEFIRALRAFCRRLRPDFWLLGEVVHGDYRRWANPTMLDSTTNYECYKGLYSSHVDRNYYEIAYALERQFGEGGLYCGLPLYNFADNHDVNRVASNLTNPAHLYPLYCLLFTMPGVPSIYYGSEWGLAGRKVAGDDGPLRPRLTLAAAQAAPQPALAAAIARLARVRQQSRALRRGDYRQLLVGHEQLAFSRRCGDESVVVAVNAGDRPVSLTLNLPGMPGGLLTDLLEPGDTFEVRQGRAQVPVWPTWARILAVR